MSCKKIVDTKCPQGHVQKEKCGEIQRTNCKQCHIEAERDDKILRRDMELQDQRLRAQIKHDMGIAELDMQIRKSQEEAEDAKTAQDRAHALLQKKRDLEAARLLATQASQQASQQSSQATTSTNTSTQPTRPPLTSKHPALNPITLNPSTSELEWARQKKIEGANSSAIDDLMALTGLEDVKEKFLDVKAKIETVARQGIDMKKERMGMVMLGNPGTGMIHRVSYVLLTACRQNNGGAHICPISCLCQGTTWKRICRDHRLRIGERRCSRREEDD
jgi:hypothetical protein